MTQEQILVELVGIFATLFVLAAFLNKGELKIRVLDLIGATIFVGYGLIIGSLSVWILNLVLIFIQVYHIRKLALNKPKPKVELTQEQKDKLVTFRNYLINLKAKIKRSKNKFVIVNGHHIALYKEENGDEEFMVYDNDPKIRDFKSQRVFTEEERLNFFLEASGNDFRV